MSTELSMVSLSLVGADSLSIRRVSASYRKILSHVYTTILFTLLVCGWEGRGTFEVTREMRRYFTNCLSFVECLPVNLGVRNEGSGSVGGGRGGMVS